MLQSIQLENFKAFGQRTVIPLAPITLIYGENSSGKSSILQALNLLKQTTENGRELLMPRAEHGLVDLGSFRELLTDHDLARTFAIRLETTDSFDECLADIKSIEFRFLQRTSDVDVSLEQLSLFSEEETIAQFAPSSNRHHRQFQRGVFSGGEYTDPDMQCVEVTNSESFWHHSVTFIRSNVDKLRAFADDISTQIPQQAQNQQHVRQAVRVFESPSDGDVREWLRTEQTHSLIMMHGFLPAQVDHDKLSFTRLLDTYTEGSKTLRPLWNGFPNLARAAVSAATGVRLILSALLPLGPFRQSPSRVYTFSGTTPRSVGYQGHLFPQLLFRHPELVSETNKWLRRLDVGHELLIRSLNSDVADIFQVQLRDLRRDSKVLVGLSDVGYGISQILPFVIQSVAGHKQLITIEQPEVHVHPRLQADLGDLLVESIKKQHNRFLIETHSEHLILRLQRRVREKKLSPTDVSVLYVSRGPNGSTVQQLRLDEDGDFMDDFPGGFFPERLNEL